MAFVEVFKNEKGAVFAAYNKHIVGDDKIIAGFAFCNPINFPSTEWSRDKWWARGRLIAEGRMLSRRAVILEVPSGPLVTGEWPWQARVRQALKLQLLDYSWVTKTSLPRLYKGKQSEFLAWLEPFLKRLAEDEQRRRAQP
jgi:hypothetical protein